MRAAALFIAACVMVGCGKGEPPPPPETPKVAKKSTTGPVEGPPGEEAAPMPPVTPRSKIRRRRPTIKLPPPAPPPPRPEGEPKTDADFEALSTAAADGAPIDKPGAPPIQRLDAYKFRVGRVFVDRQARRLEVPGKLNMTQGILEYFAVGTGGKLHEAVLEILAQPSHIHLGMVLIGAVLPKYAPKSNTVIRPGSRVRLTVEWVDPKTKKKTGVPAEGLLYDRNRKKAPGEQVWRFQGSRFWKGRYMADMERSIVGLIPEPGIVFNFGGDIGNPYRGDNLGFEVNARTAPPKGTRVTFIIEIIEEKPKSARDMWPPELRPKGAGKAPGGK